MNLIFSLRCNTFLHISELSGNLGRIGNRSLTKFEPQAVSYFPNFRHSYRIFLYPDTVFKLEYLCLLKYFLTTYLNITFEFEQISLKRSLFRIVVSHTSLPEHVTCAMTTKCSVGQAYIGGASVSSPSLINMDELFFHVQFGKLLRYNQFSHDIHTALRRTRVVMRFLNEPY